MKLAFFITSAINVDDHIDTNFPYAKKRSAFNAAERFRQTRFTINSIRLAVPDARIFVVDVSKNGAEYQKELSTTPNLTFLSLEELNPNVAAICRTSLSKGYCESLITQTFMEMCYNEVKNYDYLNKISGRYFYYHFNKEMFNEENKNHYLFQPIKKWDWQNHWGYPDDLKRNNQICWAFTGAYGIGKYCIEDFYNSVSRLTGYYTENPQYANIMDYECVMYYRILENKSLFETPWRVGGWIGVNGEYFEY